MRFIPMTSIVLIWGYPVLADKNAAPAATDSSATTMPILASPVKAQPRISGPHVFGARASHPFLYTIPVSGAAPLRFATEGLPEGLALGRQWIRSFEW